MLIMAKPKLRVILTGSDEDHGEVLFGDFRDYCGTLAHCLRRVEEVVTEKPGMQHRIVGLASGSACLELEPVSKRDAPNTGVAVYRLFKETVAALQNGEKADSRLSNMDLKVFRKLAEPLNRRLTSVDISGIHLTTQFIANIDKAIGVVNIPSDGTISGRLERLNVHNRTECTLFPPVGGMPIICTFPEEMYTDIHAAFTRTVTVHGRMTYKANKPFPERVQVATFEVHPSDDQLPTLADLKGLLPDATDGMSVIDFLRAHRDE